MNLEQTILVFAFSATTYEQYLRIAPLTLIHIGSLQQNY